MPLESSQEINISAEVWAMATMILALIETHPHKTSLKNAFDAIVSQAQMAGIIGGAETRTSDPIRMALKKYYSALP
jgi:hypothetical protein